MKLFGLVALAFAAKDNQTEDAEAKLNEAKGKLEARKVPPRHPLQRLHVSLHNLTFTVKLTRQ